MTSVLANVDGVLTPPAFSRDVQQPYVRGRLGDYIAENAENPEVAVLLSDAARDAGLPELSPDEAAVVFEAWMDEGLNVTTLLTLQGMIVEDGFRSGALKGQIYDDAAGALARWNEAGFGTYVFSGGHAPTEKLKFRFSAQGDLAHLVAGWLDLNIGPPSEPNAYRLIARAIRRKPDDIVFLSAQPVALAAAREAGLRTVWVTRTGAPPEGHEPPCDARVASLDGLDPESVAR